MQTIVRQLLTTFLLAAALVSLPAAAAQDPILTFGFTELAASFNGTNTFIAGITNRTDGDVTRMVPISQTALFNHDFTGQLANYVMTMTVSGITPNSAVGVGSLIITDVDGDTITADYSGLWTRNSVFSFYNGLLSNVYFNATGDGVFEGPSGGAFSMNFSGYGSPPYDGAIMTLETGKWFTVGQSWSGQSTLVQGSVLPEPAGASLALAGTLLFGLRRRR